MPAALAQTITNAEALEGAQRAAVLLMYLDRDVARNVLDHLDATELKELGTAIASVEHVSGEVVEQVVASFVIDLHEASLVPTTGPQFALGVFPELLPADHRRKRVEGSLRRQLSTAFQDFCATRPAPTIAAVLADEHPQSQAIALLIMGNENAGRVLPLFDDKERVETILRMAKIKTVPGELADEVERTLRLALEDYGEELWEVQGIDRAAKIIGQFKPEVLEGVLDEIYAEQPDLSDMLRRRMVIFEDLESMTDRSIQTVLKNIDRETLVVALRGAATTTRELFLKNMSTRAGQDLRDEMDLLGPVPRQAVQSAQEQIVETVMRLAEDGLVQLPVGGSDSDMV
jgi:flagellar motor switch protein FliG